jgi:hypothetical protein
MPRGATCLFTGERLSASTHLEHTLPRALGGRFRSRNVSADAFNNACSNGFDDVLCEPYAPLLSYLDPMMSAEHRQGAIEVKGADGRVYLLHPGGVIGVRGIRVERRDETGRPLAISHEDPERIRDLARRLGWPTSSVNFSTVLPTNEQELSRKARVLAPAMDVAALKSALLTFDHVLEGGAGYRFTRDAWLDFLRAQIAEIVMNGADPFPSMKGIGWGIVNNERSTLCDLRAETVGKADCPFEHILVAAADPSHGTLDVAWLLAGVDVWAFRVSKLWSGPQFTIVAGCGILRGCGTWGPVVLPACVWRLGQRSWHRSCQPLSESMAMRITEDIALHRHEAGREAVDYMERNSDELVTSGILTLARFPDVEPILGPGDTSIARGVERRLVRLFREQYQSDYGKQQIEEAVGRALAELPSHVRIERVEVDDHRGDHVSWGVWLACWRRILDLLEPSLGKPSLTRNISVSTSA